MRSISLNNFNHLYIHNISLDHFLQLVSRPLLHNKIDIVKLNLSHSKKSGCNMKIPFYFEIYQNKMEK